MNAYQALMKFYPLGLEDLPGELWKPIPSRENYQISNYGRAKSFNGLWIKAVICKSGSVKLASKNFSWFIGWLLRLLFLIPKTNPRSITLLGVNSRHISRIQLGQRWKQAGGSVRDKIDTRLPDEVRSQIRAEYVFGSHEFGSYGLAKKYGITHQTILNIIHEVQS